MVLNHEHFKNIRWHQAFPVTRMLWNKESTAEGSAKNHKSVEGEQQATKPQLGQRGNKRWGQHTNKNKTECQYIISNLWFKINYFENGHNDMAFFLILLYFTTLVPIFPFTLPSSSPTCHSTVHPHTVVPFQGSLRHVLWRIPSPPRHHFHTTYPLEAVRLFLIYMILFLFCLLFFVFITFLLVVRSYQNCGLRRTW